MAIVYSSRVRIPYIR